VVTPAAEAPVGVWLDPTFQGGEIMSDLVAPRALD
jgi:hypothetical protein